MLNESIFCITQFNGIGIILSENKITFLYFKRIINILPSFASIISVLLFTNIEINKKKIIFSINAKQIISKKGGFYEYENTQENDGK